MARQTVKAHRIEREVNHPQRNISARISGAQEVSRYLPKEASSIQRPVRAAPNVQDAQHTKTTKIRQTVSAAGIYKKKSKINPRDKKHHRRREPTPEPDSFADFRYGIDIARNSLNMGAKTTFDDVHAALSKRLMVSKAMDQSFFQAITESAATLSAPLAQEKIETTITTDGKRKVEVIEIGKRVATFKKLVEKEETKMKENWKRWDEVQNEYMELGIEVFGPESFGEDAVGVKVRDSGFRKDLESFDLEHNTGVGELDEEIEGNSAKILQMIKVSEKELDATAKKEQARLLQALIQD